MELAQLPVTEEDYFFLISCILDMLTDRSLSPSKRYFEVLGHGEFLEKACLSEIENHDRYLVRSLITMVSALCMTMRIVHPKNKADNPEQETFDSWYAKMTKRYQIDNYEQLICSACPFSFGVRLFASRGNQIVCLRNSNIKILLQPFLCGLISFGNCTKDDLREKIVLLYGEPAWKRFTKKERDLKRRAGILMG